jgi:hypothetical protein
MILLSGHPLLLIMLIQLMLRGSIERLPLLLLIVVFIQLLILFAQLIHEQVHQLALNRHNVLRGDLTCG